MLETIRVEPGYEAALAAALGDDLDAPTDAASPMHWSGAGPVPGDPALPEGTSPLSGFVTAPAALARRLAQIGVVERNEGARLAQRLSPGQRLVSKEGHLWRWDGFVAKPDAPTAAARRLAARNRIAELDGEIEAAKQEVLRRAEDVKKAEAEVLAADTAEHEARAAFHAAARASAAAEARTRLLSAREEAHAAKSAAEQAVLSLPDGKKLESGLETARHLLARHRTALGDAKAELEGVERERAARAQRLTFIGSERAEWNSRKDASEGRVRALEERLGETRTERANLDDAPKAFTAQREVLLSQISEAEETRRAAADKLAEAESSLSEADKAGRVALDDLANAREEAARAGRAAGRRARAQNLPLPRSRGSSRRHSRRRAAQGNHRAGTATASRIRRRSNPSSRATKPSASGSARSTFAPTKSLPKSRSSTRASSPSATISPKRSSGCGREFPVWTRKPARGFRRRSRP